MDDRMKGLTAALTLLLALGACTIKATTGDSDEDKGAGGSGQASGSGGSGGSDGATGGASDTVNGAGGTAMAGSAGSAGSGGASGAPTNGDAAVPLDVAVPQAGDGAAASDACSAEVAPNDDREHATKVSVDAPVQGCMQTNQDVDFYEFTTPVAPAQGGYVQVQITDVAMSTNIDATIYAAHDNGQINAAHDVTAGVSVFSWFAAQPGATYRVAVSKFTSGRAGTPPAPYRFTAKFTGVADANEPNDDLEHASVIALATDVSGFFFAGMLDSTAPPAAAWHDFYKVELPAAPTTITVQPPSDISALVELRDARGSELKRASDSTEGSSVVLTYTPTVAGTYYIVVRPWYIQRLNGEGSTVPVFFTKPYKLNVAQ